MKYDFKKVEKKWQKKWLTEKVFKADDNSPKPKYYQLETFPYPSAAGLHVGHPKGYIAEDIHARYTRMRGHEVLYTMGWDAFGLPTENYAVKIGKPPQEVAAANIANFKRQVQMFGLSYDWDREINTSSPEYYMWTQWLFIELFKKGLAYRAKAKVNWCPKDQTVLANEQVINGRCERDGEPVTQKEMEQWFFKITDYKDRLLDGLKGLDWPEATVKRQEDWIGRSEGAEIKFVIPAQAGIQQPGSRVKPGMTVHVFTTRPDTLFGATYLVLAPEHPILANSQLPIANRVEVERYLEEASHKTELMRQEEEREKTGVELKGVKAINPATKEEIPIWVADYVLGSYGTGAIMAVPAHDERDFEFAKKYSLPIRKVIQSEILNIDLIPRHLKDRFGMPATDLRVEHECYAGEGELINSEEFNGMDSASARKAITEKFGTLKVQYRLRDWSVSRQRYWGVPIPMIECEKCALRDPSGQGIQPVPEKDLPVLLPEDVDYRPKGIPPLASSEKFINVPCPACGGAARRVPETLDTFVDSSWYYLRYTDPHNEREIFDKKRMANWMPVKLYVIGAEHTVLHLLYSRFITKFLHDIGYVDFEEPFLRLRHVGLILGADGQKMSKSKGNVVNPDEIIEEFGVDTVRLYEMFMGPFEDGQPWDPKGVLGAERFLRRFYKYASDSIEENKFSPETPAPCKTLIHKTIKKVGEDIENLKFNTAISALMILLNELGTEPIVKVDLENVIKILHPFAPHMAQELWTMAGHETYLDFEPWPVFDPALIKEDKFTLVIQVNGKTRGSVEAPADITETAARELALAAPRIRETLGGKEPKKVIYVPGRLINFVI